MDPLRCSSRVLKIHQDDYDDIQQHPRKFNPTPAPITRPPSSSGNRLTKVQKIKPNTRKRHKWNDRFHIQTEEEKQFIPPPTHSSLQYNHNHNINNKKKKKERSNTYLNIHSTTSEKKKSSKSSMIPPRDIITGRRQWGKRSKKRAKWSIMKSNNNDNNKHKVTQRRSGWNKSEILCQQQEIINNAEALNPLSESRSRVLSITAPKIVAKHSPKRRQNMKRNKEEEERKERQERQNELRIMDDKEQFAKLFSNVLKNFIQVDDKLRINKNDKHNIEQKDENEENEQNIDNSLNLAETLNFNNNKKRATRKLLPINNRNKMMNQERKQYLEPLDNGYNSG